MKEGWICPRCGKVNAPFAMQCTCKADKQTTNAMSDDELCPCGGLHDWYLEDGAGSNITRVVLGRCSKCHTMRTFDIIW